MALWIIGGLTVVYLLVGFIFEKPEEFPWYVKVLMHLFWLPIIIVILFALREWSGPSKKRQ